MTLHDVKLNLHFEFKLEKRYFKFRILSLEFVVRMDF
jgi:hypothetical protein